MNHYERSVDQKNFDLWLADLVETANHLSAQEQVKVLTISSHGVWQSMNDLFLPFWRKVAKREGVGFEWSMGQWPPADKVSKLFHEFGIQFDDGMEWKYIYPEAALSGGSKNRYSFSSKTIYENAVYIGLSWMHEMVEGRQGYLIFNSWIKSEEDLLGFLRGRK